MFFIWVNVMVAIISEVYQQECDKSLNVTWDEDFPSMRPGAPQPQNDLDAMRLHYPVQSLENEATPQPVALTPDRCARPRRLSCYTWSTHENHAWCRMRSSGLMRVAELCLASSMGGPSVRVTSVSAPKVPVQVVH